MSAPPSARWSTTGHPIPTRPAISSNHSTNHSTNHNHNGVEPRELDILVGKSTQCRRHKGSRCFALFVESYRRRYQDAKNKHKRGAITMEMYDTITQASIRFLKYQDDDGSTNSIGSSSAGWKEISSTEARDKITHAIKYAQKKSQSRSRGAGAGGAAGAGTKKALPLRQGSDSSRRSDTSAISGTSGISGTSSLDWDQLLLQQQKHLSSLNLSQMNSSLKASRMSRRSSLSSVGSGTSYYSRGDDSQQQQSQQQQQQQQQPTASSGRTLAQHNQQHVQQQLQHIQQPNLHQQHILQQQQQQQQQQHNNQHSSFHSSSKSVSFSVNTTCSIGSGADADSHTTCAATVTTTGSGQDADSHTTCAATVTTAESEPLPVDLSLTQLYFTSVSKAEEEQSFNDRPPKIPSRPTYDDDDDLPVLEATSADGTGGVGSVDRMEDDGDTNDNDNDDTMLDFDSTTSPGDLLSPLLETEHDESSNDDDNDDNDNDDNSRPPTPPQSNVDNNTNTNNNNDNGDNELSSSQHILLEQICVDEFEFAQACLQKLALSSSSASSLVVPHAQGVIAAPPIVGVGRPTEEAGLPITIATNAITSTTSMEEEQTSSSMESSALLLPSQSSPNVPPLQVSAVAAEEDIQLAFHPISNSTEGFAPSIEHQQQLHDPQQQQQQQQQHHDPPISAALSLMQESIMEWDPE